MGIRIDLTVGSRQAHFVEGIDGAFAGFFFVCVLMQPDRLGNLIAHSVYRAERGHRLLKDHGNVIPANVAHLRACGIELRQVNGIAFEIFVKEDLPVFDFARGTRDEAHGRKGGNAFSAARFAD